jgi:SAM-dependent methyltransferase
MPLCDSSSWDRFWARGRAGGSGRVSWSKRRILAVLAPYLLEGRRVLDAGCGSGFFSKHFCDAGLMTVALDYAPAALERAAALTSGRARTVAADLLSPDLHVRLEGPFDIVFSDGLFEHFAAGDQDAIMRGLAGLLAPGGLIITFVPNRWSPWQLIRPFFMPGIREDPFTFSGLGDLYRRNGLDIIEAGGLNTFPFRLSPDRLAGRAFGMLLFAVGKIEEL